MLSDYFGGSNLKYDVYTKDFDYRIEHINAYNQKWGLSLKQDSEILFTKAVEIDANSYWLATFAATEARFYKCHLEAGTVACTENVK